TLIIQFLTESLLLSLLGGLLGIVIARAGLTLLLSLSPTDLPRMTEITLDARVLVFASVVSVLSGILFGLAPALTATRTDIVSVLRAHGRSINARLGFRNMLVATEVALSIVLLISAGLLLKTFVRMQAVSLGFSPNGLLLMRVSLPKEGYSS